MKKPRYIEVVAAIQDWTDAALKANTASNLGKKNAIKLLEDARVKFNRMMVLLKWKKQNKHKHGTKNSNHSGSVRRAVARVKPRQPGDTR